MKYFLIVFIALFSIQSLSAQNFDSSKELDSLYREDQIYLSVTYNILNNTLQNVSQNGFSSGFHLGFIRDYPINKRRNIALGVGIGLSANAFNQNLKITQNSWEFQFEVLNSGFDKNKFSLYQLELPFEFRWRTSTAGTYNFWRIYTGFKMGYVFSSTAKFVSSSENYKLNISEAINSFQYGLTLSVGYDSWNLHLYYGLNRIFKDQLINNTPLDLSTIKAGLIFYIL
jgi:hypothetical protein